ncbi:hypothetical protein ACFL3T_04875 [Patescibacteria group bacterium]
MENAHGWKSMNIDATIKKMFQLYKSKPVLFGGLVLLVNIPVYLFVTYIMVPYFPIWLTLILNIVIAILAGLLTLGGMIYAADKVTAGKTPSIIECYQFALGKLKDYIVLFFRIIWYTWVWVLILLLIIMGVANASLMSSFASTDTAYAQGMIDAGSYADFDFEALEALEGMEDFDFDAMSDFDFDTAGSMDFGSYGGSYGGIGMPNLGALLTGGGILNLILMLAFLVVGVLVAIRSVRVIFAYYSLFSGESTDSKTALEESVKLAKGNWWTILGYAIMAGFVMMLVIVALGIIAGILGAIIGNLHFMLFLNAVIQAIAFPLPILFYYTFYHNMRKVS